MGSDNLIRYTKNNVGGDWTGKVFIYNRVFPIISGAIPLVEALEIFKTNANKVTRIDQVNTAMMPRFYSSF